MNKLVPAFVSAVEILSLRVYYFDALDYYNGKALEKITVVAVVHMCKRLQERDRAL